MEQSDLKPTLRSRLHPQSLPVCDSPTLGLLSIETLTSMVATLTHMCRTLEERVRTLELTRVSSPRPRKRPPPPRRMIMKTDHRVPMVHLSPCTKRFQTWITQDGGFQPHVDLNYYFTNGFLEGIYHTIESRIHAEKKHENMLPLCTVPLSANRVVWMVYDTPSPSSQSDHSWQEATQEILNQLYYYAVFDTEKVFNAWDMEYGEEMVKHQPDKYAAYVVNISGRHQGEKKAKQELGRKIIEWCRT